jgi:twitching motility two-component system response regulator PilH
MMNSRPEILVVDSSASTCLFIASTLQQANYEVDIALTGQDGLMKVINRRPQCLILEALLPDISGYAVCRSIRQHFTGQLQIILTSTKDSPLDKRYGLSQGADNYLLKPFTAETLLQEIKKVFPKALSRDIPIPPSSAQPQLLFSMMLDFIPHHNLDQEAMRVSSPFIHTPTIEDGQVRRLYLAIDGKKTVIELAIMIGLEAKETLKLLSVLLRENHIQISDATGHVVDNALLHSAL